MMEFTDQDAKTIMNAIVAETYYCNAAFKYLDYDGGLQMISNSTVQFTRQDSLNDNCDCNVETLVDFSFFESLGLGKGLINKYKAKIKREIEQCGILSLGKTNDNETLWKGYSSDGSLGDVICVELDPKKLIDVLKKPLLQVQARVRIFQEALGLERFWEGSQTQMCCRQRIFATADCRKRSCDAQADVSKPVRYPLFQR